LSSELEEDLLTREDDNQDVMDMDQVESEYDTESEDQKTATVVLTTPVSFIPKSQREIPLRSASASMRRRNGSRSWQRKGWSVGRMRLGG